MKKTIAITAVLATLSFVPVQAEELQVISLDAVEQALEDSNTNGKKAMDEFASNLTSGLTKLFSIFGSQK